MRQIDVLGRNKLIRVWNRRGRLSISNKVHGRKVEKLEIIRMLVLLLLEQEQLVYMLIDSINETKKLPGLVKEFIIELYLSVIWYLLWRNENN